MNTAGQGTHIRAHFARKRSKPGVSHFANAHPPHRLCRFRWTASRVLHALALIVEAQSRDNAASISRYTGDVIEIIVADTCRLVFSIIRRT